MMMAFFVAQALANGFCGYVENADDLAEASWRHAIIYYPNDSSNFVPCEINPEENAYCCDTEAIPNHSWKPGDTIVAEVVDQGDGYLALPVSMVTTAAGHDVAPVLHLVPIIDIESPTPSTYSDDVPVHVYFLFNSTGFYSLDGSQNVTICNNCTEMSFSLDDLEDGDHALKLYSDYGVVKMKKVQFKVLTSFAFSRNFDCDRCNGHKVSPNTLVNVSITLELNGSFSGDVYDYFPIEFEPLSEDGVENYSSEYRRLKRTFSGSNLSFVYTLLSPGHAVPAKHYSFYADILGNFTSLQEVVVANDDPGKLAGAFFSQFGNPVVLKGIPEGVGVKRVIIYPNKSEEDVGVSIAKLDSLPWNVPALSEPVYSFLEVKGNFELPKEVDVEFYVEKKWLDENNYTPDQVALLFFDGASWAPYASSVIREYEEKILFMSSVPHKGYYAVVGRERIETGVGLNSLTGFSVLDASSARKSGVFASLLLIAVVGLVVFNKKLFKRSRGSS